MRERYWFSRGHAERGRQRGVALLEAAAWLVIGLPLACLAVGLCMCVHDQRVLGIIPEALLRERELPVLHLVPNGSGGAFAVSQQALETTVERLAQDAVAEARDSVVQTRELSARACGWVMRIDPGSGMATGVELERCATSGPRDLAALLQQSLQGSTRGRIGVSVHDERGVFRSLDRAIVFGLAVGGEIPLPVPAREPELVHFSHIAFPRQEMTL